MSRSYTPGRRQNSASRARQERMIDLLEEHGPLTEQQLAEMLNVTPNVINQMVWLAHEQHKAHIAGQTRSKIRRSYEVNLWGAGCKPDVLSAGMKRRLENRLKGIEAATVRKTPVQIKPFRHPQDVAFFGAHA